MSRHLQVHALLLVQGQILVGALASMMVILLLGWELELAILERKIYLGFCHPIQYPKSTDLFLWASNCCHHSKSSLALVRTMMVLMALMMASKGTSSSL